VTKRRRSGAQSVKSNKKISAGFAVSFVFLAGLFLITGCGSGSTAVSPTTEPGRGGDWWEVYFTDPQRINDPDNLAGSIPEKLIERIDAAQETIDIAAFEADYFPISDALAAAAGRGVVVRWMTDDENGIEADEDDGIGLFEELEDAGVEVRDDGRSALMHNKFIIFDGHTVWTGSTNLTRNGNFRNNNNVLVLESARMGRIFEREFEEMWNGEHGPRSPSTVEQQSMEIQGTPLRVLFAAEDEVISELTPLVASAEDSIRFMAFSFTHDDLGAAVLERAQAGVDVQGIFETRGSETEFSELGPLFCAGLPMRQDGNPGTFHHKVFIIDGQLVVTGSLNFSNNADDSNDENVVIVANEDIAAAYLEEFDRRWAEAVRPEASELGC
jgi:phosphatidylserine/phosphatidylglycerophosphate/cardiolipin synthase-like enzyme